MLRICIRVCSIRLILMILSLPDPNPIVQGTYPDTNPSIIKKNLDSYCFVISLWLFIFEKWCKCSFNLPSWRSLTKKAGSGAESRSVHQSRSANPDLCQHVTGDPQHCYIVKEPATLDPKDRCTCTIAIYFLVYAVVVTHKDTHTTVWNILV